MENLTDYQRLKETLMSFGLPLLSVKQTREAKGSIHGILCMTLSEMALQAELDEEFDFDITPMMEDSMMGDITGIDKEVHHVIMSFSKIDNENSCVIYFFTVAGDYINKLGMIDG